MDNVYSSLRVHFYAKTDLVFKLHVHVYRVAQKECNTYDQWFQQNEGQNKQAVSVIAYKTLFRQQDVANLINIDDGIWIPLPFAWGNVIIKISHFCLKSNNWRTKTQSIVWLQRY